MPSQRTRFASNHLSSLWGTIVQRLTPPSHPSTTSNSANGSSFNHTDLYYSDSYPDAVIQPLSARSKSKPSPTPLPRRRKTGFLSRTKSPANGSKYGGGGDMTGEEETKSGGGETELVCHVVVENDFDQFNPPGARSDSGSTTRTPGFSSIGRVSGRVFTRTEKDAEGGMSFDGREKSEMDVDHSSSSDLKNGKNKSWIKRQKTYKFVVRTAWPAVRYFFDSSYPEPAKERSFQKEAWFSQKQGALLSATYFLISWTLSVALLPLPLSTFNWWAYFGLAGTFVLPIMPFVFFDFPRQHNRIWQPFLLIATWVLSDILIGEMYACHFFSQTDNNCGTRNFVNFLGAAYGSPTLAILALKQSRTMAMVGAAQWLLLVGVLLINQGGAPDLFYRNLANFSLFHAFLIGTSFLMERSERQLFTLREQLKIQYRATQSAQVQERRSAESKKRFVSYIFHEVRVPLNTALLAVQNLEGEDVFKGLHGEQGQMVHGLMGSLTMMEKVLNDVLSFNRMEAGKFVQSLKPFEFHKSIQLVALSHRMQAQMAGISLSVELDRDIDKIGGIFIGDEMRLRQVTSNLVSNSVKFTEEGSVRILTKLLYPRFEPTPAVEIDDPLVQATANLQAAQQMEQASRLEQQATRGRVEDAIGTVRVSREFHREKEKEQMQHRAVIRVEVHDTGVGLKQTDVVDNRLFSPYVQTEIGRRQGGKGSGLGLALVRQIIKLHKGRLGVNSECGKGSMFWFELPFALPPPPNTKSYEVAGSTLDLPKQRPSLAELRARIRIPVIGDRSREGDTGGGDGQTSTDASGANPTERPGINTTDSTMPLLPAQIRRRSLSILQEATVSCTFPACESPPSSPDNIGDASVGADRDPFTSVPSDRRSSEATRVGRVERAESSVSTGIAQPPESPLLPLCILVADDDKLTRMLMSRMLSRLGHQVTTAENGKMALGKIKDSYEGKPNALKYDVVFLDNQMPLMSGVEVVREVREMKCPWFVVGCTGNALREDQDEYLAAGADDILTKPIHQKGLVDMVAAARKRVAGETQPRCFQEVTRPGKSKQYIERRVGSQ